MLETEFVKLEMLYSLHLCFKLLQWLQIIYNLNPTFGTFKLQMAYIY